MGQPYSLACHGSPNGAVVASFAGQLCVDVDTSNLFASADGNLLWNQLLQIGGASAPFSGLVSPTNVASTAGTIPWVVPTKVMLYSYLEATDVDILDTKDLTNGQTGRFTQIMTDVVADIRSAIASFKYGYLLSGTPNSIPPELNQVACYLIILAMQQACSEMVLEDKKARNFNRVVKDWQKDWISGTRKPSLPPDPAPQAVQGLPGVTIVHADHRRVTDHTMRGVL